MESPAPPSAQEALAALQRELSSRQSVLHFAHCSVATVLALIATGTASKLAWDSAVSPLAGRLVLPVGVLSALFFAYALARYLYGRQELKKELLSFARLQALRKQLNLDDPAVLLPR